jgi:luciferase-like monooxygenase
MQRDWQMVSCIVALRSDIEKLSRRRAMMYLKRVENLMSGWDGVTSHPHRFGGREFLFGAAEVGHVHTNGVVDIPFPRQYATHCWQIALLRSTAGFLTQAGSHSVSAAKKTFDLAVWLMRLSYLRYSLKAAPELQELFEQESEKLHLNPHFKSLLEPFVLKVPKQVSAEPLSA